jgi:cell division protein FtsI (penicillin-binding protein 3)
MDPKTGEILAMANYPTFDPTDFRDLKLGSWRNSAVQDQYAPGSVFKLITYVAALEEQLIKIDDEVDCGDGTITVGGHTFEDSHVIGNVSYITAMAQSSNVGAIKTGLKLGKSNAYRYAQRFGFGTVTGIGLPSEAKGVLRNPNNWSGTDLASISIGYGIDVTALQTAVAFATIANDGVRVQPRLVRSVQQDGETLESFEPESVRVVKSETASALKVMLREVVNDGTAKLAQLNGFTSAGKTGTVWKYDGGKGGINKKKYVSSFVGFAPANDPAVVIAVIIDEPKGASRNGGQVAGPVFRDIANSILPDLGVASDGVFVENIEKGKNPQKKETTSKSIKGGDKAKQKAAKIKKKTEKKEEKSNKKTPKELKAALIYPEGIRSEFSPYLRI